MLILCDGSLPFHVLLILRVSNDLGPRHTFYHIGETFRQPVKEYFNSYGNGILGRSGRDP